MATSPAFTGVPRSSGVQILNATGTALVTAFTPGSSGSKVVSVIVSSSDTASQVLTIGVTRSAVFYPIGTATIGITAGEIAATASVNMLSTTTIPGLPVDNDGQPYIFLASTDTLQAQTAGTVTAAKSININVMGGDF